MQKGHLAPKLILCCLKCMVFHQDGSKCFWKEILVLFVAPSQAYARHISYYEVFSYLGKLTVTSFASIWICKYFCYFSYLFHCISDSGITYLCIAEDVGITIEHCTYTACFALIDDISAFTLENKFLHLYFYVPLK